MAKSAIFRTAHAWAPSCANSSSASPAKPTATSSFDRSTDLSAHSIVAIDPLVSELPRPYNLPSRRLARNGSTLMPSTVTVSKCGANRMRWVAPGGTGHIPYTFGRPGAISSYSTRAPAFPRNSPTNRAMASSPLLAVEPDGFSLGIWTRAWHNSTALWMEETFIEHAPEDTIQ